MRSTAQRLRRVQARPARRGPDRDDRRAPPDLDLGELHQAARREPAQRVAVVAGRGRLGCRREPLEGRPLLRPEPLAARRARRGRRRSAPRGARCGPRPHPWPPLVPGGSTSSSPRAGVEQYSRATQSPSSTCSAVAPASSAAIGSASRSGASSDSLARPTTTPRIRCRPNGTSSTLPTPTSPRRAGSR